MPTDGAGSPVTGLPGSFLACVQCFELVQFGRNFHDDFTICAAKLRICEVRLLRWGVAAGIQCGGVDEQQAARLLEKMKRYPAEQLDKAQDILDDVTTVFDRARKTSHRFVEDHAGQDCEPLNEEEETRDGEETWSPSYQALYHVKRKYSLAVTKAKSARDRTMWALYEKKHLSTLIDQVAELMNGLERLFPELLLAEQDLMRAEARTFDSQVLGALPAIAAEYDPAMHNALKLESESRGLTFSEIETKGHAKTHLGSVFAPGEQGNASHTYTKMVFGGHSRTHAGNVHGYRSAFGDESHEQPAPAGNADSSNEH